MYFFLLSGFLVAIKTFTSDKKASFIRIIDMGIGRYFRLLPMVFITTLMTCMLMCLGLMHHLDIAPNVKNVEFLLEYCNFSPTLFNFIDNALIKPFLSGSDYVGPFWTIKFEFWGFGISLIICSVLKGKLYRRLLYPLIILFVYSINPNYISFVFGIVLADLYVYTEKNTTYLSKYYEKMINNSTLIGIGAIIGLLLFAFPTYPKGIYAILTKIPYIAAGEWRAIGLFLVMYCIIKKPYLQRIFEKKWMLELGKISFVTYCFHWMIMLSFEAWIFDWCRVHFTYTIAALLAFGMTIPIIYISSFLGWRWIENKRFDLKIKKC